MLKILETVDFARDTWNITFYFVAALAVIIGLFWTVMQSKKNDKKDLKENIIYDHSEDLIENNNFNKKSRGNQPINNYVIPDRDNNDYDIEDKSINQMVNNNKNKNKYKK